MFLVEPVKKIVSAQVEPKSSQHRFKINQKPGKINPKKTCQKDTSQSVGRFLEESSQLFGDFKK